MMRLPASRYAAWCCRAGTAQCSPGIIGAGLAVVVIVLYGGGLELHKHWTGFMQVAAVTGAACACIAAAWLVRAALRIVEATPLPEPVTVIDGRRQRAGITWPSSASLPAAREDTEVMLRDLRAAMLARSVTAGAQAIADEADVLAAGTLDFAVTGHGQLSELQEPVS